jgi:hypothetical protein
VIDLDAVQIDQGIQDSLDRVQGKGWGKVTMTEEKMEEAGKENEDAS